MSNFDFPVVMSAAGAQPQSPASLLQQLLAAVAATNPGYTANLPGSLVEDISSTDVGALLLCDQARVEAINSLTPYGANAYVLGQLGAMYGIMLGQQTNTSVDVVFTCDTAGFVISPGFQVTDGVYIYQVLDGGITKTVGGSIETDPLTAVAIEAGSWAVPASSVTGIVSSYSSSVTLSVTNPNAGTPGQDPETEESYRARVLQAGIASAQGVPRLIKSAVQAVPGVISRLVAVQQVVGSGIRVIVGGGDNSDVGYAIFRSWFDPAGLLGAAAGGSTVTVSVVDYPDTYSIQFVDPVSQAVTIAITWNTSLSNFTQASAVAQLVPQPIADYLNSIYVGEPINLLELQSVFETAIASVLDASLISKLQFSVSIAGSVVAPTGTLVSGDTEGYFTADASGITVTQG